MIGGVEEPEHHREVQFKVEVPSEELGGSYANFLSVWHTAHEFTLDFGVTQPSQPTDPADDNSPVVVNCHVVSRVKIPVPVVFDVLRALNQNMTRYEESLARLSAQRRGETTKSERRHRIRDRGASRRWLRGRLRLRVVVHSSG